MQRECRRVYSPAPPYPQAVQDEGCIRYRKCGAGEAARDRKRQALCEKQAANRPWRESQRLQQSNLADALLDAESEEQRGQEQIRDEQEKTEPEKVLPEIGGALCGIFALPAHVNELQTRCFQIDPAHHA